MKKLIPAVGVAAFALCSGCISAMTDSIMAKHGYTRATREEMLAPAVSSATPIMPKPEVAAFPREKLVGKWTTSYVTDSNTALLTQGYMGPKQTLTTHQTYYFFEDGGCRTVIEMGGKETSWNGSWKYDAGILTVSGEGGDGARYDAHLRLSWYGENEFEVKFADLREYENMLRQPEAVYSVICSYDSFNRLHTQMLLRTRDGSESGMISVSSPQIYEREGDAE